MHLTYCKSKLALNKCNTCQFPPFPTVSFGVTVHGDTYWLYHATTPLQKHSSFILCLFLGGKFAEVVLFCISNSLVIMSCTFFEATAPKSQKKNWVGWGEDALVSPSNMLNQIPFLFSLHLYFTICETSLSVCV